MKQMKMLLALVLCLALTLTVSLALAAGYTAGTYTAEANGNNGPVKVSVTVSADAITAVEVTEHAETPGLSDPAISMRASRGSTGIFASFLPIPVSSTTPLIPDS